MYAYVCCVCAHCGAVWCWPLWHCCWRTNWPTVGVHTLKRILKSVSRGSSQLRFYVVCATVLGSSWLAVAPRLHLWHEEGDGMLS